MKSVKPKPDAFDDVTPLQYAINLAYYSDHAVARDLDEIRNRVENGSLARSCAASQLYLASAACGNSETCDAVIRAAEWMANGART